MEPFFLNSVLQLSQELIRFKSTAERLDEREAIIEYCRLLLDSTGAKIQIKRFDKHPLLLASLKGKGPRLCLYAHLDVVDGTPREFKPKILKNRLWGRGSGDMKGSAAVMIELFSWFARQKNRPALDLLLTTDEEDGGLKGTGTLLKKGYRCDAVLIPDSSTGLRDLILEQKGLLEVKLWRKGKSAHGAHPHLGQNAVEMLWGDYEKIKKLFEKDKGKAWGMTLNLGSFSGGQDTNQVPSHAEMNLDMRFVKEKDVHRVLKAIHDITRNVEVHLISPPFIQDPKDVFVKQFIESVVKVTKKKPIFAREEGASDARFFSHYGIPALVTGVKKDAIHSEGEWASVKEIRQLYEITKDFVENLSA